LADKCKHDKYVFTSKMQLVKLSTLQATQLVLKISVACNNCKQDFMFRAPLGFSTFEPTMNNEGIELRIPVDYPLEDEEDEEQLTSEDIVH